MDESRKDFLKRRISQVEEEIMKDMKYLNDYDSFKCQPLQPNEYGPYELYYNDFSKELWDHNPQYLHYLMTKFFENINFFSRRYVTRTFSRFLTGNTVFSFSQVKAFVRHCARLIPDILADFVFESSSHVAFAINLKNVHDFLDAMPDLQSQSQMDGYNLTRADVLPQVLARSLVPPVALVNVCDGVNYRFVDVARVIARGDYNFMRMLVKYGVIDRPTTIPCSFAGLLHEYSNDLADCSDFRLRRLTEFQNQDNQDSDPESEFDSDSESEFDDPEYTELDRIRQEAFSDNSYNQMLSFYERSPETKLRIQTISYITTILKTCDDAITWPGIELYGYVSIYYKDDDGIDEQLLQNIVDCIKLFFEASAQPYVTPHEVLELLEQSCDVGSKISHFPHCREKFEECIRKKYRNVFPECDIKQPRSLKDLSRRALRRGLCQTGQLPLVLDRLGLPQSLKKYCFIV